MRTEDFPAVLSAAQDGSNWALRKLYEVEQPRLLRYLRGRAWREHEDVASDTWLDATRNLHQFRGSQVEFRAWLFTIARRRLSDHLRHAARTRADPLPPADLEADPSMAAEDEAFRGSLGDEAVARLVADLSSQQTDVVLLRVVGGFSAEEVAEMVGMSAVNVRVTQHRALKRLAVRAPAPAAVAVDATKRP